MSLLRDTRTTRIFSPVGDRRVRAGGRARRRAREQRKRKVVPVSNVRFYAAVDPNHIYGSTVKLEDGTRFVTEFNLCSTLVISVDNIDHFTTPIPRLIGYKHAYEEKFKKSLKYKWENMLLTKPEIEWERIAEQHRRRRDKLLPELAWKMPQKIPATNAKSISYTASYPAGYITLEDATAARGVRPWRYVDNKKKKMEAIAAGESKSSAADESKGSYPVIETCGVMLIDERGTGGGTRILTYPNIKQVGDHSVPGGGVDWPRTGPPRDLNEQAKFVVYEALRELGEEAGISLRIIGIEALKLEIMMDGNVTQLEDALQQTRDRLPLMS